MFDFEIMSDARMERDKLNNRKGVGAGILLFEFIYNYVWVLSSL